MKSILHDAIRESSRCNTGIIMIQKLLNTLCLAGLFCIAPITVEASQFAHNVFATSTRLANSLFKPARITAAWCKRHPKTSLFGGALLAYAGHKWWENFKRKNHLYEGVREWLWRKTNNLRWRHEADHETITFDNQRDFERFRRMHQTDDLNTFANFNQIHQDGEAQTRDMVQNINWTIEFKKDDDDKNVDAIIQAAEHDPAQQVAASRQQIPQKGVEFLFEYALRIYLQKSITLAVPHAARVVFHNHSWNPNLQTAMRDVDITKCIFSDRWYDFSEEQSKYLQVSVHQNQFKKPDNTTRRKITSTIEQTKADAGDAATLTFTFQAEKADNAAAGQ